MRKRKRNNFTRSMILVLPIENYEWLKGLAKAERKTIPLKTMELLRDLEKTKKEGEKE